MTHAQKMEKFRDLHQGPAAFLMPNPWDAGTAKILESLGYEALATTSAGLAFSLGVRDSTASLSRGEVLENARSIVKATRLPVSADLENGFGDTPEACAQTITEAFAQGLCGGSIEDATGEIAQPIYDFELAVERVQAAVEAKPDTRFMLTARAENFICDRPDLDDTIRRLQAFEAAGADVLYAPGLPDIDAVRQVCAAVSRPVNVVVGLTGANYSLEELSQAGVRRISVGGAFARAALGEFIRAATELKDHGTYGFARDAVPDATAAGYMKTT